MQADRRDRVAAGDQQRSRHSTQTIIMAAVVVILAGGAWLLAPGDRQRVDDATPAPAAETPAPVLPTPPQPEPAAAITAAPDIPEPELREDPVDAPVPEPEPEPPTVEEIDAELRAALVDAGASTAGPTAPALGAPFLLDRGVSAIDQLARGYVPIRALNVPRPKGTFAVRREGLQRYIDESSYRRYDALVEAVTALDTDRLAAGFDRFRPLLMEAYATLGYPADAVDNALVAALDTVLAVEPLPEPVALVTKGALYAYADPAVEARSDVHKQLLRMGPDNLARLQSWARDLRAALLE
jgi:hypothetical protein